MTLRRRLAMALVAALAVLAGPLAADAAVHGTPAAPLAPRIDPTGRDVSYSNWVVEGSQVRLRVTLPLAAARALAEPGKPPPRVSEAKAYVLAEFEASSAAGK